MRADAEEARSDQDRLRIDDLQARLEVDRAMIAELQADGLISEAHVAELEVALRTSRTIGAALGIVMAYRGEAEAFRILSRTSQNANRKLRIIADEIVRTGDLGDLS